jgi:hypothetical protein
MNSQRFAPVRSQLNSWTNLVLATILEACLSGPVAAQALVPHPEEMAGPWELTSASGVHGIFVMIYQQPSVTPPGKAFRCVFTIEAEAANRGSGMWSRATRIAEEGSTEKPCTYRW